MSDEFNPRHQSIAVEIGTKFLPHTPATFAPTVNGRPYLDAMICRALQMERERSGTFALFQRINEQRTVQGFKHPLDQWSLLEWAGSAAGEMGEVANVCKKIKRRTEEFDDAWSSRDPEIEELREQLGDEIGDTLAYLSLLASAAGLDLWEVVARKFDRISDKIGWEGERLSA